MTLAKYLKSKGLKLTVKRLAEVSMYSEVGLWKMHKRDHTQIDALLEQYSKEIEECLSHKVKTGFKALGRDGE